MLAPIRLAASLLVSAAASAFAPGASAQSQDLGGGVSRFFPLGAPEPAWVALDFKPPWQLKPAEGHSFQPAFVLSGGKTTATIALPASATLYGLGGLPGTLARARGTRVPALANVTPAVFGIKDDGSAFALLADTSAACEITVGESLVLSSVAPLAVVSVEGPDPATVLGTLSTLTGRFEMPAHATFGLQQAGVTTAGELQALAESSKDLGLDLSTVWASAGPAVWPLSTHAESGELGRIVEAGRNAGVRVIGVLDSTPVQAAADRVDVIAAVDAGHLVGVAPGASGPVWPVLTREPTLAWWEALLAKGGTSGLAGWAGGTTFLGLDADTRIEADQAWGGPSSASAFGSLLPMLGAKAIYKSFGGDKSPVRPQVFATGAFAVGAQRYSGRLVEAAGRDPLDALSEALSIALSGQQLIGLTIPPPASADESTLHRWIGLASLMPVMVNARPWTQWDAAGRSASVEVLKSAMARRRALSAYYYTTCFDAFFRGQAVLRPLAFADPASQALRAESRGFLIGDSILAMVPGADGPTPLPAELADRWVPAGSQLPGGPGLPDLFARRGVIIPITQSDHPVASGKLERVRLLIHPAADGTAKGVLYEDSGDGYDFYRNQAGYREYVMVTTDDGIEVRLSRLDGGFGLATRMIDVLVVRPDTTLGFSGSERGTIRVQVPKAKPPEPKP